MKLGLIIGRFQPLHDGHLQLIQQSQKENDKTLVLIGSTNQLPDFKNPFNYKTRKKLIEDSTEGSLVIRGLADCPTDGEWVSDVIANVLDLQEDPTKVTLYTSTKDQEYYQSTMLYKITVPEKPIATSATNVRAAWYNKTLWTEESNIPHATLDLLNSHPDFERLRVEYVNTTEYATQKKEGHPFGNPMEPVSFAVITHGTDMLVGKRGGIRGHGQYGLPGGYIQNDETSLDGCLREIKEELGISIEDLVNLGKARVLVQAVEENLNDIGTRTIGINYLIQLKDLSEVNISVDGVETLSYQWLPIQDVVEEKELLFYNHNTVTQRLLSKLGTLLKVQQGASE